MEGRSVSVVIPSNRGGPYLAEAVSSVRAQSPAVAEILLVDDGSPAPGLDAVARELGIRCIRQPASGIAAARNTGVRHAVGDWVAFLDDDDVWPPRRIARQLAAIDANPEAVACSGGGGYLDAEGRRFGGWTQSAAPSDRLLAGETPLPRITTLLIRTSAYVEAGGCDSAMEPSEDNDLILRLLRLGEIATVADEVVGYRRHAGNVTRGRVRGRTAAHRAIRVNLSRAVSRGDERTARLLHANRRRFAANEATDNLRDLAEALRRRQWRTVFAAASWAAIWAPGATVAAVGRLVAGRVRPTGQRRAGER